MIDTNAKKDEYNEQLQGGFYSCPNCKKLLEENVSLKLFKINFEKTNAIPPSILIFKEDIIDEFISLKKEFQELSLWVKNKKIQKTQKKKIGSLSKREKNIVMGFLDNICVNCGSKEKLHVDHIKPVSKGGKHEASNLQILCRKCNLRKSDFEVNK